MNPRRLLTLALLAILSFAPTLSTNTLAAQTPSAQDIEWVGETLKRMLTIKPGMTRAALLKVFTTEGGIFTRSHRTYVSRDCSLFKVDVEFQLVGDAKDESSLDIILKVSKPYLEFKTAD